MSDEALLAPRSPLEGLALPTGPKFTLKEGPRAARFIFRGPEEARAACAKAFGAELPLKLGQAGVAARRAALWLGPEEWLLMVDDADPWALGVELQAALHGTVRSLVDVSDRQIGLVAGGPGAARALSAGCPLDLHPSAFPVGMATRTIFHKTEVVLWRRETEEFRVEVWRSFAPYLVAALAEAARGAPEW